MVICIVGLGYVGLPLLIAFSEQKIKVIGYDSSLKRIKELNDSNDINGEFSKEELSSLKNIVFTNKSSEILDANIYIITVPTPVNKVKNPNLKPLLKASKVVGKNLSVNDIVIICTYGEYDETESMAHKPTLVYLDEFNNITDVKNSIPQQQLQSVKKT